MPTDTQHIDCQSRSKIFENKTFGKRSTDIVRDVDTSFSLLCIVQFIITFINKVYLSLSINAEYSSPVL